MDQAEKLRQLMKSSEKGSSEAQNCTSIAVTSGKGGVGKTCISISLASELAGRGKRVLIVDGDLGLANVHIMFGITPEFNISHYIRGECSNRDILTRINENLFMLPGGSGIPLLSDIRTSDLKRLVTLFSELEHDFDFLIIDGGAGVNDSVMRLNRSADRVLVVMTPDPASLTDAYAVTKLLVMSGVRDISVGVNMVSSDRSAQDSYNKLSMLTEKFLDFRPEFFTSFPMDKRVRRLIRAQEFPLKSNKTGFYRCVDKGVNRILRVKHGKKQGSFFIRMLKGVKL